MNWPVPPPFMWGCARCTELLQSLHAGPERETGSFYEQLMLARHIASDHREDVPQPHGGTCSLCTHYAMHGDADLWDEHRARGLFMPPDVARLM